MLRLLIAMGVLLPACSSPPSPYEQARARYHQQLSTLPEFQEARGQRSDKEAEALSRQLSRRGMHRLSDEQLLLCMTLRRKLLASVNSETCTAIVRDALTGARLLRALEHLDGKDLASFFALSLDAVRAELQHVPPPRIVSEAEFPAAFGALLSALPPEQADRLAALLSQGPAHSSDEDVCWAERTFLQALLSLNEPYRGILTRAIVQ
jgi:hypothetical protein